jgi:hypothetical protein
MVPHTTQRRARAITFGEMPLPLRLSDDNPLTRVVSGAGRSASSGSAYHRSACISRYTASLWGHLSHPPDFSLKPLPHGIM